MSDDRDVTPATHPRTFSLALGVFAMFVVAPPTAAQNATWPTARARHHMAYDPGTQQVLLIGGAQRSSGGAGRP